jgi:phage shock protein PspC (stress-responsive transcriptional regulator)
MFCSACAFPIETEDYFCRRCGSATETGSDVTVTIRPRLRRAEQDKKLAGVCGGVARYLKKDPRLVRAVWTGASLLPFFPGVIAYGICWIAMPRAGKPAEPKTKQKPTVITAKTGHAA